MRNHSTRSSGLTTVELIAVILVLGVLAVSILPRLIDKGQDARLARINSVYGSVRAASEVTYAAALVHGKPAAAGSVTTQGGTITTVYGYPDLSPTGIAYAAGFDPTLSNTANADGLLITVASGTMTFVPYGATSASKCLVSYTPPNSATAEPTIVLQATLTNC